MDILERKLERSQKREWLIRMLMLAVIGILAAFVVVVSFFYSDLQQLYEEYATVYIFNFVLLGFVVISLLFMGYLTLKEIAVKKLQRNLVEQEVASHVLERRVVELQAVHELTRLVNSQMVLSDVLDTICNKALRNLGGDQASLFLYDPQIGKLRCVSVWGPKSDLIKNAVVDVGKSVAGWVIKHGKPLYLDQDLNESQFNDFVKKDKKITSSLCVPLMVKNKARGVLNITLFDQKKKFAESDLKLASIFAENAAIAIDKAGLYEKLKKQTKAVKNVINELKATQNRLIQPETLKALSNLSTGMALDFKNILTAILDKIQLVLRGLEETAIPENTKQNLLKWLRAVEKLAGDGAETAKHIQDFARTFQVDSERDFEELDINAIVQEAVEVTAPKWKDEAELKGIRIEIETELGKLLNPVGNHSEIKEVLASMIFNSMDALSHGGKIKIITRMRGDKVEIKVIDNGLGMSETVKNRVFEPFFTTKTEEGHGIGLSVVCGIISRHNGEITVESEPGEGTTFTITLPVAGEKETETEKPADVIHTVQAELSKPAT